MAVFFNDLFKVGNLNAKYIKKAITMFMSVVFTAFATLGLTLDFGGVYNSGDWWSYDFAYATEKVTREEFIGRDAEMTMYLAKNESEACQFILRTRYGTKGVSISVEDFTDGKGGVIPVSLYKEHYIPVYDETPADITTEYYPDALVPYYGEEKGGQHHRNQPIYIELTTDANTPAGTYTSAVVVTDEDGVEVIRAEMTAVVWDFVLPDEAVMDTAFGLGGGYFYSVNGAQTAEEREILYKQYYDFLLDHGISAYSLPYDILDERADAYMSDSRVSSFLIPYPADDDLLVEYYTKVTSNPVWAEKVYFYPIDEPATTAAMASYKEITDRLTRLCPGYNMVTPFSEFFEENGVKYDVFSMESGKSNILCPCSPNYNRDDFCERIDERAAAGDKIWWYVCCEPKDADGYCNFFIQQQGLKQRVLFWQQYSIDITGLLYWHTVYYDGGALNPWLESTSFVYDGNAMGDGMLIYPGTTVGINEPIASLRLKNIRDGIEDYSYFKIAEQVLGRDKVDEIIAEVTSGLTEFTSSDKQFACARIALGEAISAAS